MVTDLLPTRGGLVDELAVEHGLGPEGVPDGGPDAQASEGSTVSLRPRLTVREPCVARGAEARRDNPKRLGGCPPNRARGKLPKTSDAYIMVRSFLPTSTRKRRGSWTTAAEAERKSLKHVPIDL